MMGYQYCFLIGYWYLWYFSYIQFLRTYKLIYQIDNDIMLFILHMNQGN